jgi:Flp pilus assembly secretin CpaC
MRPPFRRAAVLALMLAGPLALAILPASADAMVIPINHAERVTLSGAAASVIIGNASILAVTVVDSHTVYVMGKNAGTTNVTILDRAGQPIFTSEMTVATSGSNVTLYRGDKRVTVNCAYACVESDAAASPGTRFGMALDAAMASSSASGVASSTKIMP